MKWNKDSYSIGAAVNHEKVYLSDYIVQFLSKGAPNVVNRAHPLGSGPVSSRGVTAGWTQILHYSVWLGTRTQAGGTCWTSSWQTDEVVFGNLKAQNKTTMTSTNMFQGLDSASKPSSRVLQPPGGGSSNLFGGYEDDSAATRRPNKMASTVFAAPEEPQSVPKRSNPPGGKSSGIFGEPEAPAQPRKPVPPGGPTSNIFGAAESASVQSPSRSHPNKPKDNLSVGPEPESPAPEPKVSPPEVKEEPAPPAPAPAKEEPAPVSAPPAPAAPAAPEPTSTSTPDDDLLKNHEPRLGPKPRSHNRVLNPPGGKSSVVFY